MKNDSLQNTVRICHGKKCRHAAAGLMDTAKKKAVEIKSNADFRVEQCGCLGHCKKGPNIQIVANGQRKTITGVSPRKLSDEMDIASGKKQSAKPSQSAKKTLNDLLMGGF